MRAAWSSVLGEESFESDETWDEAGGDSLMALHLVFVIEREVMQSVSYDLLGPATRPSDLAAALAAALAPPPAPAARPMRPLVVVAPGIAGDDTALAGFRAAFEGHIRFLVLRYPSAGEMVRGGGSFSVIVEAALAQVAEAADEGGTLHLMGYSYGALVVRQLAARLAERRCAVGLVGLIDGFGLGWASIPAMRPCLSPGRDVVRALARLGRGDPRRAGLWLRQAAWSALMALLAVLPMRALPLVQRLGALAPVPVAVGVGRTVDKHLRARAAEGVRQAPFGRRAVNFASSGGMPCADADAPRLPSDDVATVPIGGSHASILDLPMRSLLVDAVARELSLVIQEPT